MDTPISKSALEVIQKPSAIVAILNKDQTSELTTIITLPANLDNETAEEITLFIAESTAQEDSNFATIYEFVQQKNKATTREIATVIDYAGKAYELVSNHWGEIFFILSLLNNKGYFDKLKDKPKLKAFFQTLFDEEKDEKED